MGDSAAMSGGASDQILHDFFITAIFMLCVYVAGVLIGKCQAPQLVGHIGMGMLWMGAGWLPASFAKPFEAVGCVGLMLMLFDGGVNMDIPVLKKMGGKATAVALSGVVFPMVMSYALFSAMGFGVMEGLACGSALASTGIGFNSRLFTTLWRHEATSSIPVSSQQVSLFVLAPLVACFQETASS